MRFKSFKKAFTRTKNTFYDYLAKGHFESIINSGLTILPSFFSGLIACVSFESFFEQHFKDGNKSLSSELLSLGVFALGSAVAYDTTLKTCRALGLGPMKNYPKPTYNELWRPLPSSQYHYPIKTAYNNILSLYEIRAKQIKSDPEYRELNNSFKTR